MPALAVTTASATTAGATDTTSWRFGTAHICYTIGALFQREKKKTVNIIY